MGTAFAWIVDRLRWALAGAAGLGLLMVYWGWSDAERIRDVEANGIQATAQIQGATRTKSRRGGETYSLKLAWRDAKGGVQTADRVKISPAFAQQIIIGDRIMRQTVRIKYLAEATIDSVPLVLEEWRARKSRTIS
jgi:hypothetical protein